MGHKLNKSKKNKCLHNNIDGSFTEAICFEEKYILMYRCADCKERLREEANYEKR